MPPLLWHFRTSVGSPKSESPACLDQIWGWSPMTRVVWRRICSSDYYTKINFSNNFRNISETSQTSLLQTRAWELRNIYSPQFSLFSQIFLTTLQFSFTRFHSWHPPLLVIHAEHLPMQVLWTQVLQDSSLILHSNFFCFQWSQHFMVSPSHVHACCCRSVGQAPILCWL